VDNVTDEKVITNATFTGDIIDSIAVGNMAPPRTFGIQVDYRFD
jgi:iron complex outermembrane receptor protein